MARIDGVNPEEVDNYTRKVLIVGWYHLISFVANATHIDYEPWATRFPLQAKE